MGVGTACLAQDGCVNTGCVGITFSYLRHSVGDASAPVRPLVMGSTQISTNSEA